MKTKSFLQSITILLLLLTLRLTGFAKDNYPVHYKAAIILATDTLPAPAAVKEVPKSRNQPIPVKVDVKPINIIKPKIIKPAIKIGH